MEALIAMLRRIADEMENGEWVDQDAAVLVTRDSGTNILTFSEWGKSNDLILRAYRVKRAEA